MKTTFIFLLFASLSNVFYGQNLNWIIYDTSNSALPDNIVSSIAIDEANNKWIGTVYGGVAKFDNSNWTIFNTSNSSMASNYIKSILVSPNNIKLFGCGRFGNISSYNNGTWSNYNSLNTNSVLNNYERIVDITYAKGKLFIATFSSGLIIFDGYSWIKHATNNSDIPGNYIYTLEKDNQGNVLIGHWNKGLSMFDGHKYFNFNTSNSILPSNDIIAIAIEKSGIIWAASRYDGLVKIDGDKWFLFTAENSGLPSNIISSIAIDQNNIKWIGTGQHTPRSGEGLVKFDDVKWQVYNKSNSDIPSNEIISLMVDSDNNKWIGTANQGLAVFNENGVVLSRPEQLNTTFTTEVFPNPFSNKLNFSNKENLPATISLFSISGQKVLVQSFVNNATINTNQLSNGLYIYQIINPLGQIEYGKVLKQ